MSNLFLHSAGGWNESQVNARLTKSSRIPTDINVNEEKERNGIRSSMLLCIPLSKVGKENGDGGTDLRKLSLVVGKVGNTSAPDCSHRSVSGLRSPASARADRLRFRRSRNPFVTSRYMNSFSRDFPSLRSVIPPSLYIYS